MDRFLIGVNIVGMSLVLALFPECYGVVDRVVHKFYYICCLIRKSVVLAIELHLEAVPGVTVRTH